MRRFLSENVLKLVVMAAAADVFHVLLRDFGMEWMVRREATIAYTQLIAHVVSVIGVISIVLFWMAFGAVALRIEGLYRGSADGSYP